VITHYCIIGETKPKNSTLILQKGYNLLAGATCLQGQPACRGNLLAGATCLQGQPACRGTWHVYPAVIKIAVLDI
jgi:hypothetical protein